MAPQWLARKSSYGMKPHLNVWILLIDYTAHSPRRWSNTGLDYMDIVGKLASGFTSEDFLSTQSLSASLHNVKKRRKEGVKCVVLSVLVSAGNSQDITECLWLYSIHSEWIPDQV